MDKQKLFPDLFFDKDCMQEELSKIKNDDNDGVIWLGMTMDRAANNDIRYVHESEIGNHQYEMQARDEEIKKLRDALTVVSAFDCSGDRLSEAYDSIYGKGKFAELIKEQDNG